MAVAIVGSAQTGENLSASPVNSSSKTTVTGNALLVALDWVDSGNASASLFPEVTDNYGNTFAKIGLPVTIASGFASLQLFICTNITGGAGHVVTGTVSGAEGVLIAVEEISSAMKKFPVRAQAAQRQAAPGTGTNAITSGTDTMAFNVPGMLIGVGYRDAGGIPTAGTGFTGRGDIWPGAGSIAQFEYRSIRKGERALAATFTQAVASETLTMMVFIAEDGSIGETEVQTISDTFSGSSGTDVTTYDSNWKAPNVSCNLKGSNQLGAKVLSGTTAQTDAPVHRGDYNSGPSQWSQITVDTMSNDYTACTTHCANGPTGGSYESLQHHAFGLSSGNSDIYYQRNGPTTEVVNPGPAISDGDVARFLSVDAGGMHYARLNGETVMIGRERTIPTGGFPGTGCVVGDSTDGVRISNFLAGYIDESIPSTDRTTTDSGYVV